MNETRPTGGSGASTFLKIVGFGCGGCLLLIVIAAVAIYAMLPSDYDVERSIVIEAPMEVVFPLVDTPARWPEWDPWSPLDADMEREYKGPPAGEGAESHWDSASDEVGEGMFRITESTPGRSIELQLEFQRPFEMSSTGRFAFAEVGDGVRVTWQNHGELSGAMRFMGFFADAMLGNAFEQGLTNLKELAEGGAAPEDEPATDGEEPAPDEPPAEPADAGADSDE